LVTLDVREIQWANTVRYLGVYLVSAKMLTCAIDNAKKSFYRPENDLSGRIFIARPNTLCGSSLSICVKWNSMCEAASSSHTKSTLQINSTSYYQLIEQHWKLLQKWYLQHSKHQFYCRRKTKQYDCTVQ